MIYSGKYWIGTNYVNKVRKWFECESFKGFTIDQQDDLEFLKRFMKGIHLLLLA